MAPRQLGEGLGGGGGERLDLLQPFGSVLLATHPNQGGAGHEQGDGQEGHEGAAGQERM